MGYSTLEFDSAQGGRGKRQDHVRSLACDLFGCEDALAVNNNASAVLLALAALARGREVLVSRGELVAIGGSFQIPEILEASGARLREVGTTNRTTRRRLPAGDDSRGRPAPVRAPLQLRDSRLRAAAVRRRAVDVRPRGRDSLGPRPGNRLRGAAGRVRRARRADGRAMPRLGRGPRHVLRRQALLGAAGGAARREARRSWRAPPPIRSPARSGRTSWRWRLSPRRSGPGRPERGASSRSTAPRRHPLRSSTPGAKASPRRSPPPER